MPSSIFLLPAVLGAAGQRVLPRWERTGAEGPSCICSGRCGPARGRLLGAAPSLGALQTCIRLARPSRSRVHRSVTPGFKPSQSPAGAAEGAGLHQRRIWAIKYHFHLQSDLQLGRLLAQTSSPGGRSSMLSSALAEPLPGNRYLREALLPGTPVPAIKLSLNFKGILKCVFMAPLLSLYNPR